MTDIILKAAIMVNALPIDCPGDTTPFVHSVKGEDFVLAYSPSTGRAWRRNRSNQWLEVSYCTQTKVNTIELYTKILFYGVGFQTTQDLHRIVGQHWLNDGVELGRLKVDHIQHVSERGNPYQERLSNLRLATNSQNLVNTGVRCNNKTGFKGVKYINGKPGVGINTGGTRKTLTTLPSLETAAAVYDIIALAIYGEFAVTNHPLERYSDLDLSIIDESMTGYELKIASLKLLRQGGLCKPN